MEINKKAVTDSEYSLHRKDMQEARLPSESFVGLNMRNCILNRANLRKADFTGACLANASCNETQMSNIILRKATLTGASFIGSRLYKADMREAHIRVANFTSACLKEVNITGATYDVDTIWPIGFDPKKHGAQLQSEVNE